MGLVSGYDNGVFISYGLAPIQPIGGMVDGGDDLQGAAAPGALLDVDLEHPFTKALPGWPFGPAFAVQNRSLRFCEQPGPAYTGRCQGRGRVTVVR
jgi:hypothetical protein